MCQFLIIGRPDKNKKMAGGEEINVVATEEEAGKITAKEGEGVLIPEMTSATVCKFFLEGRCRFGESCLNRHQGSLRVKPKETRKESKGGRRRRKEKKEVEETQHSKLPSMKTAADVISRLQWDKQLPIDRFTVGYIDRFKGVLEQPFTAFCWEDLASVDDYEVLAIPQHRIQYFKYSGSKVWEKATRLDVIFGSTGDQRGIVQVMEEVDLSRQRL